MPLSVAPLGVGCKIVKIAAGDKMRKHLENLGLTVGERIISVSDNSGNVIIKVKDGRVALNRDLATCIHVSI